MGNEKWEMENRKRATGNGESEIDVGGKSSQSSFGVGATTNFR